MSKRREFVIGAAATTLGLAACIPGSGMNGNGGINGGDAGATQSDAGVIDTDLEFKKALIIPAELTGEMQAGRRSFALNIQSGKSNFLDALETPTWGINGVFLGPTIRLKKGEDVDLKFTNTLSESTTIHGHGMHLPAVMDGGPYQVIEAGASWTASYKVNQHACTNWYHPHFMHKTAQHVMNGLAGMIIIDDDKSDSLDLPKRYGIDDIPLIIQDRAFKADGSFKYAPTRMEIMRGWRGDTLLTNGVIKPYIDLEAKEIRFRILNGSNARVYKFAFASGRKFKQITTDNSFLEAPVELSELVLSPAERAEIVVDFSDDLNSEDLFFDKDSGINLFKAKINKMAEVTTKTPNSLVTLEKFDPANAVKTRTFTMSGRMGQLYINDKQMDMNRIDETINLGDIEVWEIKNTMRMVHNFHIHATHFRVIERNGSAANVAANEKGYKDVVMLPPNESVKIVLKMVDYKDPNGKYMYHCHILEHEDAGMMGQFVVV